MKIYHLALLCHNRDISFPNRHLENCLTFLQNGDMVWFNFALGAIRCFPKTCLIFISIIVKLNETYLEVEV